MFIYTKPKGNFTILPNDVIDNERLSIQAIAIYAKLRRNCTHWSFNAKSMAKKCGVNIKTFYKYMKELYTEGLIKRVQNKESGKFTSEVVYIFVKDFHDVEVELDVDSLQTDQIQQLETSLKNHFDESIAKNEEIEKKIEQKIEKNEATLFQNSVEPKMPRHNNTIVREKTKESLPTFAFINLAKILNDCKSKIKARKEREKDALLDFTSQLEPLEREAYLNYIEYRREKKKLSKHTLKRIQARFMRLRQENEDMREVVDKTIVNGWIDLYPLKTKQQRQHEEKVKQTKQYKSFRERYKDFDEQKELEKLLSL